MQNNNKRMPKQKTKSCYCIERIEQTKFELQWHKLQSIWCVTVTSNNNFEHNNERKKKSNYCVHWKAIS